MYVYLFIYSEYSDQGELQVKSQTLFEPIQHNMLIHHLKRMF